MNTWRVPSQAPEPQEELDPYRFPGLWGLERKEDTRSPNSPPDPEREERPVRRIRATDHRRLALHAALTTAGVPPRAGDLRAIEAVSALDDTINAAVQRWITGGR
ncbi:hypothetical protein ACFWWA_26330 [Streptomyces goshikiensis]|uniref:hypothetical protein n=1 Tax=Streptomyces goshikiensis TaxID=1942 RepID=UPI00364764FC